jgi:hypothetical protein
MEEVGSVSEPAIPDRSVHVRHERFTVTRKHVARPEVAHEANTVQVCTLALLDQDCDKILVGIELDALATAQVHLKRCLSVGCVREGESENSFGKSAFNTPFNQYTPDSRLRERLCQS